MDFMNKKWHNTHKMLKKASLEERIRWHLAHAENCGCRSMPLKLSAEIRKRKLHRAAL